MNLSLVPRPFFLSLSNYRTKGGKTGFPPSILLEKKMAWEQGYNNLCRNLVLIMSTKLIDMHLANLIHVVPAQISIIVV